MSDNITPQNNSAGQKLKAMHARAFAAFILFFVFLIAALILDIRLADHWWTLIAVVCLLLVPYAIAIYHEGRWMDDPSLSQWNRRSARDRVAFFIIYNVMWALTLGFRLGLVNIFLLITAFAMLTLAPYFLGRLVARRSAERV